jgi:hypothetical protein
VSKVKVLYETDRAMMLDFSSLCVGRLNNHLPLRLFLSPFQRFLDANVHKEIEKNRLIIEHAAAVFEKGRERTDADLDADFDIVLDNLFALTVKVDNEFMKKLSNPFFSMEMRYDDLAEVRKKRMLSLARMVFDLLGNWHEASPFDDVVKSTYEEKMYQEALGDALHLYNVETRLLSNSITMHGPAGAVKDLFAEKLFTIMEETARDVVAAYARRIYVDEGCSIAGRAGQ